MLFNGKSSWKEKDWNWVYPVLGLLVYYGLFSSLDMAKELYSSGMWQSNEFFKALARFWKIIIFAISQLLLSRYVKKLKSEFLIVGPVLAFVSSVILFFARGLENDLFTFSIQALESIGESFTASAIIYYIREEAADEDWSYFGNTTLWRLGALVGPFMVLTVGNLFANAYPEVNAFMLSVMRLGILVLVVKYLILNDRGAVFSKASQGSPRAANIALLDETDRTQWAHTFRLDALLGAITYSVFYILVFAPLVRASLEDDQVFLDAYWGIEGNFAFAILAVFLIWVYAKNKLKNQADTPNVLFLQIWSVSGLIVVVILWIIALKSGLDQALIIWSAVYGFFSMVAYQLSEVAVGTTGIRKHQGANLIRFMGVAKIGQLFGVVGSLVLYLRHGEEVLIIYLVLALIGLVAVCYQKAKVYRTLLTRQLVP